MLQQVLLTGFNDKKTLDSLLGEATETDQPDGENVKVCSIWKSYDNWEKPIIKVFLSHK